MTAACIQIKRIYAPYNAADGYRVLVDRLWPRGIRRSEARIDLWLKAAAPSAELRRWFNHDPARWEAFQARYFAELQAEPERLEPLFTALQAGPVTLLYASRDEQHNQAVALRRYLIREFL